MSNSLLLEIFTEDIPARLHRKAIDDATILFSQTLVKYKAEFDSLKVFVSPRRLVVYVSRLLQETQSSTEVKRGPRIGADKQALDGFLSSNNKTANDLEERGGYYYLTIKKSGTKIISILGNIIDEFIANMPWQKSMRWFLEKEKQLSAFWIRPIRSVLCLYNNEPCNIYIKSIGITTGNYSYGHRFLSNKQFVVKDFDDYQKQLSDNNVMLDFEKKRTYIESEISQQAASMGLIVKNDDDLLDEVAGLVEYPFVHIGHIEEKFMSLPMEVLSTSMRVHQKYFTLTYPDSHIAPFFATVTNISSTDTMHKGFERVLRARLSDAMFFFQEDTDVTLEAYSNRLSNVIFHEKLGSVAQKIDRLMSVANSIEEHRTIALCKADLVSQMVGEFPELQGTMGGIYASAQGESSVICEAIKEHYKPQGASDKLPNTFVGSRVSFFDKLDTLVGFLGVGIKPTGSKDPFALRRAALSIIRLICDSPHDVLKATKLSEPYDLSWYIDTLISAYAEQGIALAQNTKDDVNKFLKDRLPIYISEKLKIDNEICWQVIESCENTECDFRKIRNRIVKLNEFSKLTEFSFVKNAYKRAKGIIGNYFPQSMSEIAVQNRLSELQTQLDNLKLNPDDFESTLLVSKTVLEICETVLINDPDVNIKNYNFAILYNYVKFIEDNLGKI